MNPMVPGLTGGKMSSSEIDSKIDLLDKPDVVSKKIESSVCVRGNPGENGVLQFFRFVVLPIVNPSSIEIDGKSYSNYDEICDAFESEIVSADALKTFLKEFLIDILTNVQNQCENDELREIMEKAYNTPPELDTSGEISEGFKTALELKDIGGEKMKQLNGDFEVVVSLELKIYDIRVFLADHECTSL